VEAMKKRIYVIMGTNYGRNNQKRNRKKVSYKIPDLNGAMAVNIVGKKQDKGGKGPC
jgi:hypothetical protein